LEPLGLAVGTGAAWAKTSAAKPKTAKTTVNTLTVRVNLTRAKDFIRYPLFLKYKELGNLFDCILGVLSLHVSIPGYKRLLPTSVKLGTGVGLPNR
jgi:hypothetical protein